MTFETRVRRASQGVHRAVEVMEMTTQTQEPRSVEPFDRYRDRKQRNRRIGALVVVGALVVGAIVLISTDPFDRGQGNVPATPDGGPTGTILFGVWGSRGSAELYSVDTAGGPVRDLHVLVDPSVAWFPDGTRILVPSGAGPAVTREPLRPATVAADGTGFELLGATTDPELNLGCGAISPDGSRLACMGFGNEAVGGLYTVRASDGGDLERLTDVALVPADYSPDGTQIASFLALPNDQRGTGGTLYVVAADGGGMRRITQKGFVEGEGASWSPDGQWIAFSHFDAVDQARHLYLVHPDGTGLHPLRVDPSAGLTGEWDPAWSPDGRRIAFEGSPTPESDPDIYLADGDGSNVERVGGAPGVEEVGLDWGSPSG